jgi:hypothetical protein
VELSPRRATQVAGRTPVLASLGPVRRYMATDLQPGRRDAGGPRRSSIARAPRTGRARGAGRHARGRVRRGAGARRRGRLLRRAPFKASGASSPCAATSRPRQRREARGTGRTRQAGPRACSTARRRCADAVRDGRVRARGRARRPLRGARGRAGDARDAQRHVVRGRRRGCRSPWPSSPTGASRAPRAASWSATSRPRRPAAGPSPRSATVT